MSDYTENYYSQTLEEQRRRPASRETVEADACIVGGGLAGLAVALGLAERGKKVVVLESRRVGWGASGRNGGFVLAGYAAGADAIIKKTGLAHAKNLFALTRQAQALIRRRIETYGIDCHPVDGHLLASWFKDAKATRKKADFLRQTFDMPVELWPKDKVHEVCRTQYYHDGLFFPDYFHIHPLNYVRGLARAVEDKGGSIFEFSTAASVKEEESGFTVCTDDGKVRTPNVVYCGSAYFNGLDKNLSAACLPVSTYVMVTDPLPPEKLEAAITMPYAIRDTRWADDYYRRLPDGSLLWGGRVGIGHLAPPDLGQLMLGDMLKIYPQLAGATVHSAWAGTMGYTTGKMPHVGQLRPGLWACTNFGGNGVGPTTAGGEVIAAAIAQGDETYKLFAPFLDFSWAGGALGPYVAKAIYRGWEFRDWVHELKDRIF